MQKYTATAPSGNIVDEMMEALRPHVSPAVIISTPGSAPKVITQSEARAGSALEQLEQMRDYLNILRGRLELALDSVAIACDAHRCQQCGSWALKNIEHDGALWCQRCVPSSYCPF